ncbi:MAG: hypothetical protein EZS28_031980, partial [Streblomastix strix]
MKINKKLKRNNPNNLTSDDYEQLILDNSVFKLVEEGQLEKMSKQELELINKLKQNKEKEQEMKKQEQDWREGKGLKKTINSIRSDKRQNKQNNNNQQYNDDEEEDNEEDEDQDEEDEFDMKYSASYIPGTKMFVYGTSTQSSYQSGILSIVDYSVGKDILTRAANAPDNPIWKKIENAHTLHLSLDTKGSIHIFDPITAETEWLINLPHHFGTVTSISIDPSGLWFVIGTNTGRVAIFDIRFQVPLYSTRTSYKTNKDKERDLIVDEKSDIQKYTDIGRSGTVSQQDIPINQNTDFQQQQQYIIPPYQSIGGMNINSQIGSAIQSGSVYNQGSSFGQQPSFTNAGGIQFTSNYNSTSSFSSSSSSIVPSMIQLSQIGGQLSKGFPYVWIASGINQALLLSASEGMGVCGGVMVGRQWNDENNYRNPNNLLSGVQSAEYNNNITNNNNKNYSSPFSSIVNKILTSGNPFPEPSFRALYSPPGSNMIITAGSDRVIRRWTWDNQGRNVDCVRLTQKNKICSLSYECDGGCNFIIEEEPTLPSSQYTNTESQYDQYGNYNFNYQSQSQSQYFGDQFSDYSNHKDAITHLTQVEHRLVSGA